MVSFATKNFTYDLHATVGNYEAIAEADAEGKGLDETESPHPSTHIVPLFQKLALSLKSSELHTPAELSKQVHTAV